MVHSFFGLMLSSKSELQKQFLLKFVVVPLDIFVIWIQFSHIYSLLQILGGGADDDDDDDDDRMLMENIVALPFTFKSILRQNKNYGNSNIFHHAKIYIIFKKSSKRN